MAHKSEQSEYKKSLIFACITFLCNYPSEIYGLFFCSYSKYAIVTDIVRVPMPLFYA